MFSVQKLEHETILSRERGPLGVIVTTIGAGKFAIVDEEGAITTVINPQSGEKEWNIFDRKATAQELADLMNRKTSSSTPASRWLADKTTRPTG